MHQGVLILLFSQKQRRICIIMLCVIKMNTLTSSGFWDRVNTLKEKKKKVVISFSSGFSLKKGRHSKKYGKISPPSILVHVLRQL